MKITSDEGKLIGNFKDGRKLPAVIDFETVTGELLENDQMYVSLGEQKLKVANLAAVTPGTTTHLGSKTSEGLAWPFSVRKEAL